MPTKKTVVYECTVCGTEVTVTSEGLSELSPIYCCDIPLLQQKKLSSKRTLKLSPKKKASAAAAKKTTERAPARKVRKRAQK
jgi:DNA-directed RNA polymerase subunit RPC12/RpoP